MTRSPRRASSSAGTTSSTSVWIRSQHSRCTTRRFRRRAPRRPISAPCAGPSSARCGSRRTSATMRSAKVSTTTRPCWPGWRRRPASSVSQAVIYMRRSRVGPSAVARLAKIRDPEAIAALLSPEQPLATLLRAAWKVARGAHGERVTYSPKVFIPLTMLCRDNCGYCTFAHPPRPGQRAFLTEDEVLAIAQAGVAAGCFEALFTLGDRPERRYRVAREELAALGFDSTIDYLVHVSRLVLERTGLIPHVNPGVLSHQELALLRTVSASGGLML